MREEEKNFSAESDKELSPEESKKEIDLTETLPEGFCMYCHKSDCFGKCPEAKAAKNKAA